MVLFVNTGLLEDKQTAVVGCFHLGCFRGKDVEIKHSIRGVV